MADFVFITGATSGFGEACARKFAAQGYDIVITGRREDRLSRLRDELVRHGVQVISLCFDVRSLKQVEKAVQSLPDEVKQKIAVLINNAGLAAGRDPIDQGRVDDWEQMIDTNIKGLFNSNVDIFFNIGSIAGKEVYPMGNVYCATKHAVDALSRAMRIDLVNDNIKVTNIAPGAAETEFSLVRFKGDRQKADATYEGFEPLVAEDIAETIYFVATCPKHVTINDLVIMPTAQASATVFHKK
ncbi:putative serine 3-dehydrogenase [Ancylostoma ceylanicum]|uniref:Putative serine 3-dehydrogenase n=1 Tax=Ancylostoma ceylanicum TaxID=53326 RepID=A0A0D6L7Q1_9BILA|nr:putative serine 3-dehydrogenase [Ancylostoma ceylanicum]